MAFVVGALLALASLAVLAFPFLRQRSKRAPEPSEGAASRHFIIRRQNIYEEIHTLQSDHEMGNISDEEYRRQLDQYRLEAAVSLKEQDDVAEGDREELEREVEEQIQALRRTRQPSGDDLSHGPGGKGASPP